MSITLSYTVTKVERLKIGFVASSSMKRKAMVLFVNSFMKRKEKIKIQIPTICITNLVFCSIEKFCSILKVDADFHSRIGNCGSKSSCPS